MDHKVCWLCFSLYIIIRSNLKPPCCFLQLLLPVGLYFVTCKEEGVNPRVFFDFLALERSYSHIPDLSLDKELDRVQLGVWVIKEYALSLL